MSKFVVFVILFSSLIVKSSNISFDEAELSSPEISFEETITSDMTVSPTFTISNIPDSIYENMLGKSIPLEYKDYVDRNSLSYLQLSYYGFDGNSYIGEMVVSSKAANDVLQIFKELYDIHYPIEKIKLIDEYNANDELSMSDNNTSCFCYRAIANSSKLSKHSLGLAIDINPLYNPYIVNGSIYPASSALYANRGLKHKYQISKNDNLYKIFIKHRLVLGWRLALS